MRLSTALAVVLLVSVSEVTSNKKFPTATRPPVPPPPPPRFVFGKANKPAPVEMIAPAQIQTNFKPTLTLGSPDYNVGVASGSRPPPQQSRPPPQTQYQQRPQQQQYVYQQQQGRPQGQQYQRPPPQPQGGYYQTRPR